MSDPYLAEIRAAVESGAGSGNAPVKAPRGRTRGETPNHEEARLVTGYLRGQEDGRVHLLAWHARMHSDGLNLGETGSVSHEAHYLSARGATLLLAMRNRDELVIDSMCKLIGRDLALKLALSTPDGRVVTAGVRCPFAPGSKDRSDQRVQTAAWVRLLTGKDWRRPKTLRTADDWLGHWSVLLAQDLPGWAVVEADILKAAKTLPVLRYRLLIQKGPHGMVSYFPFEDETEKMRFPAIWALSDFREPPKRRNQGDDEAERYGFDLKGLPSCPGGATSTTKVPWAGGEW